MESTDPAKPEVRPHADSHHDPHQGSLAALCLAALGVVYGDIGTSPLYAMRECFHGDHAVAATHDNILGVLSLIFWSLTIVISIKYLSYVMRADNRGEGGILALMALGTSRGTKNPRARAAILVLGIFGATLLYGDGAITPAISVLSAVEGLEIAAPGLHAWVAPITVVILVGLFLFQRRGTAGVGMVFGPVTLVWFTTLAVLGVRQIVQYPQVIAALSPTYGINFLLVNHWTGFLVLGAVFLVVTGGEALYADMGHFGRRPIRLTWFVLVLPALLLNYLGQGAELMAHPENASNPFYLMAPGWALYPMLILATMATIIASQAVISGAFSLTRQAVMLGFFPRVRILHTSTKEIGQIYIPVINWLLMLACIGLVLGFGSSTHLAAAYGIAVNTDMVITTLLAFVVATGVWKWSFIGTLALSTIFIALDVSFFAANAVKVVQGGWFPLLLAALVFFIMTTWHKGRQILRKRMVDETVPLDDFFELMVVEPVARVPGTAVFMTSNAMGTPPALMQSLNHTRAVHNQVILMTIKTEEIPIVPDAERVEVEELPNGFHRIVAHYGFTEEPDVPAILARDDTPTPTIEYTTFFVGRETIIPQGARGMSRSRARLFSLMLRNALDATAFFGVPPTRVLEVGAQVEL